MAIETAERREQVEAKTSDLLALLHDLDELGALGAPLSGDPDDFISAERYVEAISRAGLVAPDGDDIAAVKDYLLLLEAIVGVLHPEAAEADAKELVTRRLDDLVAQGVGKPDGEETGAHLAEAGVVLGTELAGLVGEQVDAETIHDLVWAAVGELFGAFFDAIDDQIGHPEAAE